MTSTRWSEEEMREIEIEPPVRRGRRSSTALRTELSQRNLARAPAHPHELTRGAAVIYAPAQGLHGNFIEPSYRRILAHPDWSQRLLKAHTAKRQARPTGPQEELRAWHELDAATSSDALLMNIFCYPRVLHGRGLCALLGIEPGTLPEFGYHPRLPLERGLVDRTEIDLRLGSLLLEAKLTEADFQFAPLRLLERYPAFNDVFARNDLELTRYGVRSYQLLRGVLAAHAESEPEAARFCVLLDARRPDLIAEWYAVVRAVRSLRTQAHLRLVTWQEIAAVVPASLRRFLSEKYGIEALAQTACTTSR